MARPRNGNAKSPTERGDAWKQRIRDQGFKKLCVVVPKECEPEIRAIEKEMRARRAPTAPTEEETT